MEKLSNIDSFLDEFKEINLTVDLDGLLDKFEKIEDIKELKKEYQENQEKLEILEKKHELLKEKYDIKVLNKKNYEEMTRYYQILITADIFRTKFESIYAHKNIKFLEEKSKKIDEIMANIYGFFGLIIGLLAFIFVNFQLITTATSLSLGKMIIYMGLANVGLITGITIILIILSLLLQIEKENKLIEKIKNNKKIIIGSLIGISLSILAVGVGTYFAVDKPENRDIINRIEKLEGDKPSNNILGVSINGQKNDVESQLDRIKDKIEKLQDENEGKDEKIKILNGEIEILKNSQK